MRIRTAAEGMAYEDNQSKYSTPSNPLRAPAHDLESTLISPMAGVMIKP